MNAILVFLGALWMLMFLALWGILAMAGWSDRQLALAWQEWRVLKSDGNSGAD